MMHTCKLGGGAGVGRQGSHHHAYPIQGLDAGDKEGRRIGLEECQTVGSV